MQDYTKKIKQLIRYHILTQKHIMNSNYHNSNKTVKTKFGQWITGAKTFAMSCTYYVQKV